MKHTALGPAHRIALTVLSSVAVAVAGIAGPAAAGAPSTIYADQAAAGTDEHGSIVAELEPYVSVVDGQFVLEAPRSVMEKVGPEAFHGVINGMALTNQAIQDGVLVPTSDLRAVPATDQDVESPSPLHHGVNALECAWWGCEVHLDAEQTSNLLGLLAAGAGTATVTAALCGAFGVVPCAVPAGVAAGIIAIGAGTIQVCANSHGVWIRLGVASWCGGQ